MKPFGAKLRQVADGSGETVAMAFDCPGCRRLHMMYVRPLSGGPARGVWDFNWDEVAPTFSPSLLVRWSAWEPPVTPQNLPRWRAAPWQQTQVAHVCHSFIREGKIEFLSDCTHNLAGLTVELIDLETPC